MKVLHPELLPDRRWRERFIQEAQAASGLAHPGIVPVYDVVDDPGTPTIVFQLVDGESLEARLARDGSIPVGEATRIAAQIAGALDHAHRAGVIHRDVKPANIVLAGDGRARLVDFGIARVVDDASAEPGQGEVVGTLRYMAPEQRSGEPGDARTDLYALGLVISEMQPDLSQMPGWLAELVARLSAADPARRPASAADVARALETGRLEPVSAEGTDARAGVAAAAVVDPVWVDPDAVTRTFDDPVEPPAAKPVVPPSRPKPHPAAPRRSVTAAVLVSALILGAVVLGRAAFLGVAGQATTGPVIASPVPTLGPTTVPVQAPAPAGPRPHKTHGHGRGG